MPWDSSLTALSKEQVLSEHCIKQDRFDSRLWHEIAGAAKEMQALVNSAVVQGVMVPPAWPNLIQDVWAAFYKAQPELLENSSIAPASKVNRPFLERLLEAHETAETRLVTMLDEAAAAVAALRAGQALLKEIQRCPEVREALEQGGKAEQEQGAGLQQALDTLQKEARFLRTAIRAAAQAGKEEAVAVQQALSGWGLETADLRRVPPGGRVVLLQALSARKVRKMADLIGKMRALARSVSREKLKADRHEVHSITLGSDLAWVLPCEFVSLQRPGLRLDFFRRFTEKSLLQYSLKKRVQQGRGPLVMLLDVSGSMQEKDRLDWGVAVSLALASMAGRQKRRAALVAFNTMEVARFEFAPNKKPDIAQLAAIAELGASGGTRYEPPLHAAIDLIGQESYKGAGVVMITDGECFLEKDFKAELLAQKERLAFKIDAVLIEAKNSDCTNSVAEWADRVRLLRDLTSEAAAEIFKDNLI